VLVIRDCTTSGCHSWDDVYANGWHHNTDLSGSENCVACHSENIVAEITPFSSFQEYPPSVVTPTPFSCENCHWEQGLVDASPPWTPGDIQPAEGAAGHPSTYDHRDSWNNFVGYYEYGKPILGNFDNHHMGFKGNVAAQCWKCHSNDPNDPSWDPYEPELIRYCEICHNVPTLHTIFPHVGPPGTGGGKAVEGWLATGFHAGGGGDVPGEYIGQTPGVAGMIMPAYDPLNPNPTLAMHFEANDMCFGCHGDAIDPYTGETASAPVINTTDGMVPLAACPTAWITLTGSNFGEEQCSECTVDLKDGGVWVSVPVYSWTDTTIVFEIPAWLFAPGNYKVRVHTNSGNAQTTPKLTIKDCASPKTITDDNGDDSGPCKGTITLTNGTGAFGLTQDNGAPGTTDGVYHTVVIASSQGTYVAQKVQVWANNTVKFKMHKSEWFEDTNGNFLRDTGEPEVLSCDGLNVGTYSVYFKYIFYGDYGTTAGSYDAGDTLYQVETSNPITYELTNDPGITGVNPKALVVAGDVIKIIGINFGPTQNGNGFVYTGSNNQYNLDTGKLQNKIKMWSSTKIKIKVKAPAAYLGKKKNVWVVKDGMKSNAKKIQFKP
jgi:hypothetical protein